MYLSIKEAARFLNVSENKVRGYIASGRLSTERKGRQVLIPELQLKALRDAEKSPQDGESRQISMASQRFPVKKPSIFL